MDRRVYQYNINEVNKMAYKGRDGKMVYSEKEKEEMKEKSADEIGKLHTKYAKDIDKVKNIIGEIVDGAEERNQLHILVIFCSEIIAGMDEKKDRIFVSDSVRQTLEVLKD